MSMINMDAYDLSDSRNLLIVVLFIAHDLILVKVEPADRSGAMTSIHKKYDQRINCFLIFVAEISKIRS